MKALIIDPANSTGYCVLDFDELTKVAEIVDWGFLDVDQHNYAGDQYIDLVNKIEHLIVKHNVNRVAIEDYFFNQRSAQGSTLNCAYRAVIHFKCRQLGLHYDILNISLWKNFVNGRTKPTKDQAAKWGKEPAKKLMTQESLYKRWDIMFPNHSISNLTGKPIKFRYDIVDAVGMTVFFASIYLHAITIEYSIPVNDIEWKKEPKGTYEYGGNNG